MALDNSPLRHIPDVTGPAPEWTGLLWLAGFILAFLIIAFTGFRRRDVV
jgi:ABC-2 type transport system permease protein